MYYEFDITVPAQTTEADPKEEVLELVPGPITKFEFMFPDGCYSLAQVRIFDSLSQLIPRNPAGSVKANNGTVSFNEHYQLKEPPYRLIAKAWNDDDSYAHTITVRILIGEEMAGPMFIPGPVVIPVPEELK